MRHLLHQLPVILPVLFWAGYHYWKDRHLPEPMPSLALALLLGFGSYYLAGLMYQALGLVGLRFDAYELAETNFTGFVAYAVLAIGGIEELAKIIPFLLFVVRFKDFDEPIDGIIYASFIALGFAALENVQYLHSMTGAAAWGRGFAAPIVHIMFASVWGYYIGRAWLCERPIARVTVFIFLATAILHGLYNVVAIGLPAPWFALTAVLVVGIWAWRLKLIDDLHSLPPGPCPVDPEK
jgi:RsiW-degrading membrane proteinase PrsW (M82 family)